MLILTPQCSRPPASVLTLLLIVAACAAPVAAQSESEKLPDSTLQLPHWVWVGPENAADRRIQQELSLDSAPASAQLKIAADF